MHKFLFLIVVLTTFTAKTITAQNTFWYDGFETNKSWTYSGDFERAIPSGLGGVANGNPDPSSAFEGSYCIGTDLTSDGDYNASTTSIATSPVIDCSSYTSVTLNLHYWLNVEDNTYDQATIEVYDGSTWNILASNTTGSATTNSSWKNYTIDVSSYADGNANFKIRFKLVSDGGVEFSGWNVDAVYLKGKSSCPVFSEDFESYTSGLLTETNDGVTKQWIQNTNTASVNNWTIGTGSGALTGTQGLTINDGAADASYDNADNADKSAFYYTQIDGRNYKNLKLNFNWKATGETNVDFGKVGYSTNGTNVYELANEFSGQSTIQAALLDFSAADEKKFYLNFNWINDANSTGSNPSFTVDDISLTGQAYLNYGFSEGQRTYSHISGTVLSFDGTLGANLALPADFNFNYLGTIYSHIRVSQKGWIEFYNSTPSFTATASENELLSKSYSPLIAPLWDDLIADVQTAIIYKTEGDSPNRIVTVEYRDVLWGGVRANFQVKLYETTHVIEFIYGKIKNPTAASASIGINGMCQTVFMSVTPASSATVSMDIPYDIISSSSNLTEGLIYSFSPYALQAYNTMQAATLLIGQETWPDTSSVISTTYLGQRRTPGASSSAISSKNVLVVGSRTKNRVLLWNSIPTTDGTPADIVLGQSDFISSAYGTGTTGLNGVTALAFSPDGNKLIVADVANNRILIWNTIPTSNGKAADVVVGQPDFTTVTAGVTASKFDYPTGVIVTISGKMIVTDHDNNRVLIFNKIPTSNGVSADVVIGQSSFTTNGTGNLANQLSDPWDAGVTPDGKLLISDDGNNRIVIFNQVPTSNGASADYVIGQSDFGLSASGTAANKFDKPNVTVSPEGKLACGDWGNNRVLIFNRVPTQNGASADEVLGQDAFTENFIFSSGTAQSSPDNKNMYRPYSVNFDLNGRLIVNGNNMNRVMLFGDSPSKTSDLQLSISSNTQGSAICMGTPVTLTITVKNNGPDLAHNVVAKASLPANFTFLSSSFTAGTYNNVSGFWTIPAVPVNQNYSLTIKGNIQTNSGAAETMVAYANITSTLEKDNDFSNNSDSYSFSVINNHTPTLSTTNLTDAVIAINGSTGARTFGITDADGDAITFTHSSTNTSVIPDDNTHIVISAISAGNSDIDVLAANNLYGYSNINLIATDVNGCSVSKEFKISVGNIWEGDDLLKNTDWATAANWSGAVPSSTLEAIIPSNPIGEGNYPIISADASCKDLTIEEGANLTLNDGFKLDAYGDIKIKSTEIQTGSFVDLNSQANINAGKGLNLLGTGQNTIVQRFIKGEEWHYLAMPLSTVNSDIFTKNYTGGYFNPNFYAYDETNLSADWKNGWTYAYNTDHSGKTLTVAQGYAYTISGFGDKIVDISGGNLNSGDLSLSVSHTTGSAAGTAKEGWNLIGNPYPSGLNADEFLNLNATTNGTIDGTLYYWDEPGTSGFGDNSSLYAYYNSTGYVGSGSGSVVPDLYISSGQAFFVHVTGAGGNIEYHNSMREKENSYFFKSTKANQEQIKLNLAMKNPSGNYNELLVALLEDADDNFNPDYDAYKLRDQFASGKFAFYSLMNEKEMAIQATNIPDKDRSKEVDLGFETSVKGLHKIYFRNMECEDTIPVYLIDSYQNIVVNLLEQEVYLFQSETGKFNDRFKLHFGDLNAEEQKTDIMSLKNNENVSAYSNSHHLFFKQKEGSFTNGKIYLYDITGRLVSRFTITDNQLNEFNLPTSVKKGIYLIQAIKGTKQYRQKLYIE